VHNSAIVLEHGQLRGVYRKTRLVPGEKIFTMGDEYPVFEVRGLRYGINICHDTQFADPAAHIAQQGARVLLVPAQNMMRRQAAQTWKHRHNQIRAERVKETGMWLISADVTGKRGNTHIGYGPTSVTDPSAGTVAQVPLMTTGMVIARIPDDETAHHPARL
jgi:predicted amidohydrolase